MNERSYKQKKATSTLLVRIKVLTIGQNKSSHYWSDWLKRGTVIGGQESSRIQQTQEYKLQAGISSVLHSTHTKHVANITYLLLLLYSSSLPCFPPPCISTETIIYPLFLKQILHPAPPIAIQHAVCKPFSRQESNSLADEVNLHVAHHHHHVSNKSLLRKFIFTSLALCYQQASYVTYTSWLYSAAPAL